MKKTLSFLMIAAVMLSGIPSGYAAAPATHEIFVAPNGSDTGDGTITSPFKTIKRAQEKVRELNDDMTGDINVYLREGVYRQTETLEFTEEDSGTNGYYVNYKGYKNEKAKISGGIEVTGWSEYNNKIWKAKVEGIKYAPQLYVNERRARRAQSNEPVDVSELYKLSGSAEKADGILNYDIKYASYRNPEDIQLHFARGFRSYMLNVEKITKVSDGSRFKMQQPAFRAAMGVIGTSIHNVAAGNNFWLENAFEELDTPGEFYYDRKEKMLYYMPRDDEDMKTADVELATVETLMTVKGKNSGSKVKNITFDSLSFAHAIWRRGIEYGHVGDQAQDIIVAEDWTSAIEPGYTTVEANIMIDRAEKINFTNCNIYDMGCVGIGLYYGVYNCRFEGNAFYDINDSAMTVGLPDQVYEDEDYIGTNIAAVKVASSSGHEYNCGPQVAIDNNKKTVWSPKGKGPYWWQVDLGEPSNIDRIEIDDRIDSASSDSMRSNMEILGSNDPEFKTYKQLASLGSIPFEGGGTAVLNVGTEEKFRYVRIKKNDYFVLADVRVIDESIPHTKGIDVCKYNTIKNNVITRIGQFNYGAPGVQAYYVQGMDISHNHIYEVPYSGVCVGWNWDIYTDSTVCRDNRVNYNLIENHMQVEYDGGGIYILGNQPNSTKIGNYIREQYNNLSALYLDTGSEYYTMKNNVTETAPFAFSSAGYSFNNLWQDNWHTASHSIINLNANCMIDNNSLFIPGNAPLAAVEVMKSAGLEEKYEGLEARAGKNYWPVTRDIITNNAKYETEPALMPDSNFVAQYLTYYIHSAQEWMKIAEVGDRLGQYPQSAVDKLNAEIEEANKALQVSPVVRQDILEARYKLFDAIDEFTGSMVTYEPDELIEYAKGELSKAVIGSEEGMNSQKDYDTVLKAISELQADKTDKIAKQYLEQSIISLSNNKVNLDIHAASIPDQAGITEIDKENRLITIPVKHKTDITKVIPTLDINEQVVVTPDLKTPQDFTNDVVYTLSTEDGAASKQWTVRAQKPIPVNSDTPLSLKDAIADKNNWNMFTSMNCSNYSGEIYGDVELDFEMEIASREMSYPGFVFRTQDPDKDFTQTENATYIIIFTPGQIEFYRFNDGVRTQFYGPVQNCTTIFGGAIQTNAFRFGMGEKNKMKIVSRNEGDGVRLALTINGEEIFNFVDNYEGVITQAGYIGTVSPDSPVILTAE